jgi:hypothetical protein
LAKLDIPAQQGRHGEGAALERIASTAQPPPAPGPARPPVQPFAPGATPMGAADLPAGFDPQDVSGGYDEALFAPSDRPHEPLTHGAPFGDGANFTPMPAEDEWAFRRRIADQLEQDPAPSLQPYIAKLRAGG